MEVPAYESRCPEAIPAATLDALRAGSVDAICFTSGKTVLHTTQLLAQSMGEEEATTQLQRTAVVSIGPQTSERCRKLLGRVDQEANPHDLEGLVMACVQAMQNGDSV